MFRVSRRALLFGPLFLTGCGGAHPTDESDPVYEAVPLTHTFDRLTGDNALSVGYFGGSITAGVGASSPDQTSWRAQTTAHLRRAFPAATITEINAALNRTGSVVGAERVQKDLIAFSPDLVFVEFAVNDFNTTGLMDNGSEAQIKHALQSIVEQIRQPHPQTDMVFVLTLSKDMADKYYRNGQLPTAVAWHFEVARTFRIPALNVGRTLWDTIREKGDAAWETYLPDHLHPSDAGHAVYANAVTRYLNAQKAAYAASRLVGQTSPQSYSPGYK